MKFQSQALIIATTTMLCCYPTLVDSFLLPATPTARLVVAGNSQAPVTTTQLPAVDWLNAGTEMISDATAIASGSSTAYIPTLTVAEESWRQYVPLAVSCLVIIDILLGSPLANSVLGLVRQADDSGDEDDDGVKSPWQTGKSLPKGDKGERIDSAAVAQAAIDKAQSTLELKRFLEEQKTDWDKMEDIRKKMDQQLQAFDEKMADDDDGASKK